MSEADMENFDDIPDENTMDMMNRAYARARVRSAAAENTAANVLPAHCKESARECARRFTRVNACVRAFFERSARGRGLLRELLPMSENLLARACDLAGSGKEEENIPLANAAVCRRTLTESLNAAIILLCRLSAYSAAARDLTVDALALAYLVSEI